VGSLINYSAANLPENLRIENRLRITVMNMESPFLEHGVFRPGKRHFLHSVHMLICGDHTTELFSAVSRTYAMKTRNASLCFIKHHKNNFGTLQCHFYSIA